MKKQENQLIQKLKSLKKQIEQVERQLDEVDQVNRGDRPSPNQAKLIQSQNFSFGVYFERRKALRKVRCKGLINKSTRRFSSAKEANQHGKRFAKIHKHVGFTVVKLGQKANAWINWKTGKTNPAI